MLKKLTLRNFQLHKKFVLELDKYVTTIIGASDKGKSSLIRGLRMVCFNKPARDSYVRRGQSKMSVTLDVGKNRIKRVKGKGVNKYFLDGKEYKSFGAGGIPADISKILNVDPVNFQNQHDLHYWFSDSASQVSRNLNQIVNLDVIDKALANASRMLRQYKAEEEVTLKRFEMAKHKKRELSWVPDFCAGVERLELLREDAESKRGSVVKLAFLVKELQGHDRQLERLTAVAQEGKKAVSSGAVVLAARQRRQDLEQIIRGIRKADQFANLQLPDFDKLLRVRLEADAVAEKRRNLEMLIEEYRQHTTEIELLGEQLAVAKKKLQEAGNGVCPTCGKSLQLPSETSTCPTGHRSRGLAKRTGTG